MDRINFVFWPGPISFGQSYYNLGHIDGQDKKIKKFMTQVWKRKRRKSKLLKKQQTKNYVFLIFLLEKSSIIRENAWHGFIDLRFILHVKIFHVKSKYYSYLHENKIMFL